MPFWVILVILGSLMPGKGKDVLGTLTPSVRAAAGEVRWQHRAAHYLVFGSTALLLLLIARGRAERLIACLIAIALGCLLEVAQDVIYRQGLEWWDIRDDTIAALLAYVATLWAGARTRLVRD